MKLRTLLVALPLLLAGSAQAAPILYGGNTSGNPLFTIDDLTDGDPQTQIGGSTQYDIRGMAADGTSGIAYAGNHSRYFSIDLNTGEMTNIDSTPTFDINALSYGAGGVLYGGNSSGNRFFRIDDPTTGAMTNIAVTSINIRALAYDASTDTMYAADLDDLYTIDTVTGALTHIGTGTYGTEGMAIDPTTGRLYGGLNGGLLIPDRFFEIDKLTGAHTLIDGSSANGIAALAFVPEPGTMLLLGSGLLGLALTGRRRS